MENQNDHISTEDPKPTPLTTLEMDDVNRDAANQTMQSDENIRSQVVHTEGLGVTRMPSASSGVSTSRRCLPTGDVLESSHYSAAADSDDKLPALATEATAVEKSADQRVANDEYSEGVTNFWMGEFQRRSLSRRSWDSSEFLAVADHDESENQKVVPSVSPPAAAGEKKANIRAGLSFEAPRGVAKGCDTVHIDHATNVVDFIKPAESSSNNTTLRRSPHFVPVSRPGAYALPGVDSETSTTERRSSLVREVRDSLGQNTQDENETNENLDTISGTKASVTEVRESDGSESGSFVAKASKVDNAEAIFYAQDVQHDNTRKLAIFAVFLSLCAAAVVALVVILTKDEENEEVCIGDPNCCLPLEEQNTFQRCSCSNSTSMQYTNMNQDHQNIYDGFFDRLLTTPLWFRYGEEDWDKNNCSPLNQVLLYVSAAETRLITVDQLETIPEAVAIAYIVLMMVYASLNGVHWNRTEGWGINTAPCQWSGVGCLFVDTWHELILPDNGLSGTIPSSLEFALEMRTLDFSRNNITGTIPDELASMMKLGALYLGETQLTGTLPDSLTRLERLGILDLHLNELTGTIPPGYFQMPVLRELEVASNSLAGSLPNTTYDSPQLAILRVNNNQLTGTIPPQLADLQSLELLNLGDNDFSGSIPDFLGSMPRLQFINFYNSGLTGSIPETFCVRSQSPLIRRIVVDCRIIEFCSCCEESTSMVPSSVTIQCGEELPYFAQGLSY